MGISMLFQVYLVFSIRIKSLDLMNAFSYFSYFLLMPFKHKQVSFVLDFAFPIGNFWMVNSQILSSTPSRFSWIKSTRWLNKVVLQGEICLVYWGCSFGVFLNTKGILSLFKLSSLTSRFQSVLFYCALHIFLNFYCYLFLFSLFCNISSKFSPFLPVLSLWLPSAFEDLNCIFMLMTSKFPLKYFHVSLAFYFPCSDYLQLSPIHC